MLDEFGQDMDHTETRLDQTMKKMAKVMHMSNGMYNYKFSFTLKQPCPLHEEKCPAVCLFFWYSWDIYNVTSVSLWKDL